MKTWTKLLIGIPVGAAVLFGAMLGTAAYITKQNFQRGEYPADRSSEKTAYGWYPAFAADYPRESADFPYGDLTLKGYLYGMENTDRLLVFAHGIGTGHEAYMNQLCWFVDHGWRVFAYDAVGCGDSPGDSTVGLTESALVLDSALTFAEQDDRLKNMPKVLLGHSWGGFAVGGVLNFDHDVKAAAELSGYAYPMEMMNLGAKAAVGSIGAAVFSPFSALYNKIVYGKHAGLNAVDGINKAGIPFLAMHGERDGFVKPEVGIFSQTDKITNPHAEFVPITGEFSHHNDFFHSEECNRAVAECYAGDSRSQEELLEVFSAEHFTDADKALFRAVNEPLLQQIQAFYEKVL